MNVFEENPTFTSIKDFAYHELKKRIWNLELYPGNLIVEEELVKKLGVSRTPLREALSILEHEKLVERQPNKRLKVSLLSVKEVTEIFQVRAQLESIAVKEATENATAEDLENLAFIVHLIQQVSQEHNLEKLLTYGERFHLYIYEISRNNTVTNILLQLHNHIKRYRNLILSNEGEKTETELEEHRAILEAMQNKDKDTAAQLMKKHIEDGLEIAITAIDEYQAQINNKENKTIYGKKYR